MQQNQHWIKIKELMLSNDLALIEVDMLLDQLKAFYADVSQYKQTLLNSKLQTSEIVVSHAETQPNIPISEAVSNVNPNEIKELSIPIMQQHIEPTSSVEQSTFQETQSSSKTHNVTEHIQNASKADTDEEALNDDTDEFLVEEAIKPTETFSIKNLFGLKNQKSGIIKAQLGINDRILMANTFFNGNEQLFYSWLEHIEKVQSWEDAYDIFKTDIEKPTSEPNTLESKAYELLELLLKKFFSSKSL